MREWRNRRGSLCLPGGESLEELQKRAWGAVQHIVERHPDGIVVVVSHSFALFTIVAGALGIGCDNFGRIQLKEAAISILDFGERGVSLVLFNDTCHLADKEQ